MTKQDRQKWIVDEEAAPIVERIFHSIISGKSMSKIAEELTSEKILTPTAHWCSIWERTSMGAHNADPCKWSVATIIQILQKEEYMGGVFSTKQESKATNPKSGKPPPKGDLQNGTNKD